MFAKNTTEAINRLARSLAVADDSVVLTTMLEHHSNDLPWRGRVRTVHVQLGADGALDIDDLDRCLAEHAGHVALLAVSGASNVTGVVQPIHELAEKVHSAGGRILVDAAQLAPHRTIDMRAHDDPGHLDFVALSAHKMYAPYGTGALVGARAAFAPAPEHGVGVRNGCFCAHPYIARLLQMSNAESRAWVEQAKHGDKRGAPGMVRISFGCYNNADDVDIVTRGLEQLVAGEFAADYAADVDGSFHPVGYVEPLLFSLDGR